MEPNTKTIGYLLIAFSVVLLAVLTVVKINTDTQGAYLCDLTRADPNRDMGQCPAHNTNTSWLLIMAFGVGFLMLIAGTYLSFFQSMLLPAKKPVKVDVSKLDEDEKSIYELLAKNEGSMYQSDIMKEKGYSKVKITRILDKLEQHGLVERKRRGMTNIVVLR